MLKKLFEKIKTYRGLFLLILILFAISIATIKPDFYLMGWDNYSSYFNLKTNIFRTLFATWRQYRGLGVPSDSEVTDIFRQLFYLVISPFVPQTILDQLYIVFSLITGIIVMYFFASYLAKRAKNIPVIHEHQDVFGFFAGLLYLFNLNTLAVFYFPMIMYINRFFTLPALFFIFTYILNNEKISLKKYVLFAGVILFSSGSYITATVFITVLMALGIFGIFQENLKKFITVFLFFLGLNLFWLLPFFNYTIQKSKIVQAAPTFIEANEAQLNKPKSFYSLTKQLILYPNFLDTEVNNLNLTKKLPYHPIIPKLSSFPQNVYFYLFPLLYIIGSLLILFVLKEKRRLLWVPAMIFVFVFLSQKEYSFLGFFYSLLDRYVPYFSVFFRFGDTKFHSFIAFPGSIAGAIMLMYLTKRLSAAIKYLLIAILIFSSVVIFSDYFNGRLFGFFMYNKIPQAYFDIASIINNDRDDFRVVHLPFDKDGYWKIYQWGMMGSAFFEFLTNKPLIDKTFEPASEENARLDQKMYNLIDNFQAADQNNTYQEKADSFYNLMKQVGVKYLILDETVSSQIYPKGVTLWGNFNLADSKTMVSRLESLGLLTRISSYQINILDYMNLYEKVGELRDNDIENIKKNPYFTISLFMLQDHDPKIEYIKEARPLDGTIQEGFDQNTHYFQDDDHKLSETYPFRKKDLEITVARGKIGMEIPTISNKTTQYVVELPEVSHRGLKTQSLIEVYAKIIDNNLVLSLYQQNTPYINGVSNREKIKEITIPVLKIRNGLVISSNLKNYVSNWQVLPYRKINDLRLKVGDSIIPIPFYIDSTEKFIGSVVANQGSVAISLLQKNNKEILIDPNGLIVTENPNCFGDALANYQFTRSTVRGRFELSSQSGTTCFSKSLKEFMNGKYNHIEVSLGIKGSSEDLDHEYQSTTVNSSKPILKQIVQELPKPNFLYVCVRESAVDQCFNTHTKVDVEGEKTIVVPADRKIASDDLLLSFALNNLTYQKQTISIDRLSLSMFDSVLEDSIVVSPRFGALSKFSFSPQEKIDIKFSTPLNYFSYYNNPLSGFFLSNAPCDRSKGYRTFRQMNEILVSYFENCDNTVSEPLQFSSNNLYLWSVQYNVASGKYPKFILNDGFNNYVNEYFSLDQGYPNIKGFKTFQTPEFLADKSTIQEKLLDLQQKQAYIWLKPHAEINDERKKSFILNQYSENEGLFTLRDYEVTQIPNVWNDLVIYPENSIRYFSQPNNLNYQDVLPSLWKVTVDSSSAANSNMLLFFNEAYDNQWGMYKNTFDVLIGKRADVSHVKCDGYANCFELKPESGSYYIFYWPEKLNFLGWFGILVILISAGKFLMN